MTTRKITSLFIGISFLILLISGLLSFFFKYNYTVASIYTLFGLLFSAVIGVHIKNNLRPLKSYFKGPLVWGILMVISFFSVLIVFDSLPIRSLMKLGVTSKINAGFSSATTPIIPVTMDTSSGTKISLDVKTGPHYWNPQIAIWIEDNNGNYIETLFVTKATAKGIFYGGRSKDNFKSFDSDQQATTAYRRVNALPVWSHKRGIRYADGLWVPSREMPLADAITGETISHDFLLKTSTQLKNNFHIFMEINVAFDDNEYYSAFDFPEDDVFHNGTGQLGQPSVIYTTRINENDLSNYYLLKLVGHGHHSAQNGTIYKDLSTLSTAKNLIERILVKIEQ